MNLTRPLGVLVIGLDAGVRRAVRVGLETERCRLVEVQDVARALAIAATQRFDVILLEPHTEAPGVPEVLASLRARRTGTEIVVVTTASAVSRALRAGADDYLLKPFCGAQVCHLVRRIRDRVRLACDVAALSGRLADEATPAVLDTDTEAMRRMIEALTVVAPHDSPVLIRGEPGTGKSLLARELHRRSRRSAGPLVVVQCASLTGDHFASTLFGDAVPGSESVARGKLEQADGGTLVLDDVGDMTPALQARMLRFVQERTFERTGETITRSVDVRLISATSRDVDAEIHSGSLRKDLFFHLNTVELTVPPLRDRPKDVPRLARAFAASAARAAGRIAPELSASTAELLCRHAWPGNVRELKNAMERAVMFTTGGAIEPAALPPDIACASPGPWLGGAYTLEEVERAHVAAVLARAPTQEAAARILGLDTSTLWRWRQRQKRREGGS